MRHRGRFVVGNHAEGQLLALAPIAKPDVFVKREIAVASLLHSFNVDALTPWSFSRQTILDFMASSRCERLAWSAPACRRSAQKRRQAGALHRGCWKKSRL